MTVGAVVLARLDSCRLPGKALADIDGSPMLERVVSRARRIPGVDTVVVATTDRSLDDPIAEAAAGMDAPVTRGSAEDVLGRCMQAASEHSLDVLIRLSGDSPFLDPAVVAEVLNLYLARSPDLATNVFPRTFPPGVSAEVMGPLLLQRIATATEDPADREHVTRYAYAHPDRFAIANVENRGIGWDGQVRLTVDEPSDLERARWIARRLPPDSTLADVLTAAREWRREGAAP